MCRHSRGWREGTSRKKTDRARESAGQYKLKHVFHASVCTSQYHFPSSRYRRDARSLDEDEELWFNDDDDDDEGEAVEKSRIEDDFSDSYGKYMEAKKGQHGGQPRVTEPFMNSEYNISNVLAGAANGASNNVKAAALPPGSAAVTPNSSSASSVKTVSLPATPVMKVTHSSHLPRDNYLPWTCLQPLKCKPAVEILNNAVMSLRMFVFLVRPLWWG